MNPTVEEPAIGMSDELPPPPSRASATVPGYALLEEIGRGGMGVVYRARHQKLNRIVALKLLRGGPAAGAHERERFLREARAGAALQHSNIVQVFDVGEYLGAPFLAMEMVEGGTLAERLTDGPLPPKQAAELIEQLACGVEFAHRHGVIHRDLKPGNVLLEKNSIPKIADFGLARLLQDESNATVSGTILGTPSYMAPEQAAGRIEQIGPASDVYSLGAILYECLTGRPPFRAASPVETLHQVETVEPVSPSRLQQATPRDLSTICLACLQKEPLRRYLSAGALSEDLRRFLEGRPIVARPVGAIGRTWRWCWRNPKIASLLTALALAIVVGFIGIFTQWQRAEQNFTLADNRRKEAEANLKRYQRAAEDFADLIDVIDMDQLLNIRAASMRRELLVPALERNRQLLKRISSDPGMRAEAARAQFHIAVLTRVLSQAQGSLEERKTALAEGRKALDVLESMAADFPAVVQYKRDRAALTQNVGFLTHAVQQSADALPIMQSAHRMRQELFDGQRDHLDYRSELASTWNDIGLIHQALHQFGDSLEGLQSAIELQKEVVRLAPHIPRYRRFLCNHYFNRAMTLKNMNRPADASLAVNECHVVSPNDPEQWFRIARIHAAIASSSDSSKYADEAMTALFKAVDLGFRDLEMLRIMGDLNSLRHRPDYLKLVADLERRSANADRQ